jgi:hypothetical protein
LGAQDRNLDLNKNSVNVIVEPGEINHSKKMQRVKRKEGIR